MNLSDNLVLKIRNGAKGDIYLPGSKSISIRVLLLASLAKGETTILGLLDSEDTNVMINVLKILGVSIDLVEHNYESNVGSDSGNISIKVKGCNGFFPNLKKKHLINLDVGNSGLTIRTILPALSISMFNSKANSTVILNGVKRMRERPISELVDGLCFFGSDINYIENSGFVPLKIKPSNFISQNQIKIKTSRSSQFLTGLLQISPFIKKISKKNFYIETDGEIISRPYVDLTIDVLKKFGVLIVEKSYNKFEVKEDLLTSPKKFDVEGDASSASYFLASGVLGGGPVTVHGINRSSFQGDIYFANVLQKMGAKVVWGKNQITINATKELTALEIDCLNIPDAAMTFATISLYAKGVTRLNNISSWKVKETDRILAIANGLKKLGAKIEFGEDWLEIYPPKQLKSAYIETFDDHRIAMTFALSSFFHPGDAKKSERILKINNPKCVNKTFPNFFQEFTKLCSNAVPIITIDGPTASGKGTVAKLVSEFFGFKLLDSGIFYRSLALIASFNKINDNDELALANFADNLNIKFKGNKVFYLNNDITNKIRNESIGIVASKISVFPLVRRALLRCQRDFATLPGLVADGRDMGSIVFPNAKLRVFLTAKQEIRAERRYKQLIQKEIPCTLKDILQDIADRDLRDSNRKFSSLTLAKKKSTIIIDSSLESIDQVVRKIINEYNKSAF